MILLYKIQMFIFNNSYNIYKYYLFTNHKEFLFNSDFQPTTMCKVGNVLFYADRTTVNLYSFDLLTKNKSVLVNNTDVKIFKLYRNNNTLVAIMMTTTTIYTVILNFLLLHCKS